MKRRWGVAALAAALQPIVVAGPAALGLGLDRVVRDGACWTLTALAVAHAAVEASGQCVDDDVAGSGVDRRLAAVTAATLWAMCAAAVALCATTPSVAGESRLIVAGAALYVVGIALRAAAMRRLGAHFVTEARGGQPLVTDGIFAWARHPSEAGLVAIAAGVVACVPHPALVAMAVVLLAPTVWMRIRREEERLALAAPAAHARYVAEVGALGPRPRTLVAALRARFDRLPPSRTSTEQVESPR